MPAPRPEDYPTRAAYRWARRNWLKAHGGYLWTTLALAIGFGVLTGNAAVLVGLVLVALVGTAYARSRP